VPAFALRSEIGDHLRFAEAARQPQFIVSESAAAEFVNIYPAILTVE